MAALSTTNPTLLDIAKATDPDGTMADVVEILNETNEVLDDMTWLEGNLPTGHRTTLRAGIPAPTWRKLNSGVQPNKSRTVQNTYNCGMLEAYAEVDKALADLNGNAPKFRLQEDRAHIEGISQEIADTLFYGNEGTEPEAFTGLSPYFNSLSADNAENIITGGGAGNDNGSIWLVVWSSTTAHGIIPKGSKAGLQVRDLGEVTIEDVDGNGGRMQAYRTHYRMDAGLCLRDWRYVVRIPNIDKSALTKDASSGADLNDLLFQALNKVPNLNSGRATIYMSRDMRTWLGRQTANLVKGSTLTTENVGGKMVSFFNMVPIKRCDALSADETLVS